MASSKASKWKSTPAVEGELMIRNGWSFSRYSAYDQCPAKAMYKFIKKLPEPPAPPLDRGSLIHKQAENFLKGLPTPIVDEKGPFPRLGKDGEIPKGVKMLTAGKLPLQLSKFESQFAEFRGLSKRKVYAPVIEGSWAFTRKWEKCDPTDWDNCWVRIKVDFAYVIDDILYIIDWKTGKFDAKKHAEYLMTLQLYALGGLLHMGHIKAVRPSLYYLDVGRVHPEPGEELEYDRSDVPKLKKLWEARVEPMFEDRRFDPKPSSKCAWCSFSKAKGGPCQY